MKGITYFKPILFILCLFLPQIGYAKHGNTTEIQIKEACESNSTANQSLCLGFINGAVQTYLGMQNLTAVYKNRVCVPENVGLKQLRELFLKHASYIKEDDDADADVALIGMMILEFPCHTP